MIKKNNSGERVVCPALLNYIIKISKKQFELYNFAESLSVLMSKEKLGLRSNIAQNLVDHHVDACDTHLYVKTFEIGPVLVNNATRYQIGLVVSSRYQAQVIELITMLDRLFGTALHLNNYALVINQDACPDYAMLDLLGVTSTCEVVAASNIFEFKSFFDSEQRNFCYGTMSNFNPNRVMVTIDLTILMELAEPYQKLYALYQKPPLYVVAAASDNELALAMLISDHLVANGLCVQILFENDKAQHVVRARELHAAFCLFVRPEDRLKNTILIKNMLTGVENTLNQKEIVSFLSNKANSQSQRISQ